MANFKDRLRKGFDAHNAATASIREIEAILASLDAAVKEETRGKVGISIMQFSTFAQNAARIANLAAGNSIPPELEDIEKWVTATAEVNDKSFHKKLAKWERSVGGYPCVIRFGKSRLTAYDKAGLEDALGEMLEFSETAKAIKELIKS